MGGECGLLGDLIGAIGACGRWYGSGDGGVVLAEMVEWVLRGRIENGVKNLGSIDKGKLVGAVIVVLFCM